MLFQSLLILEREKEKRGGGKEGGREKEVNIIHTHIEVSSPQLLDY